MSLTNRDFYRFDEFELQPSRRILCRQGQKVPIAPKTVEVLLYLLKHSGRVVLKEELLKSVWPESFVEESNLTQHIFWLRKALHDKADYVVTIPGRGYEFTGQVQHISEAEPESIKPDCKDAPTNIEFRAQHSTEVTRVVFEETSFLTNPLKTDEAIARWRIRPALAAGIAAIFVGVLGLVFWGIRRWHHGVVAGDHHEVVLSDFENSTGDPDFDRALKTLLVLDLNQSPYFVVASDGGIRKTLKLMDLPPDGDLSPAVAREVCERLNDQVVLSGLIARFGQKYLITLTARDCSSGKNLAQTKAVADNRDSVIAAVDSVADNMRKQLGEPLRTLNHPHPFLPAVHTFSLDALKAYSQARSFHYKEQFKDAAGLYQRAIDLDPNFASAYAQLANCYNNLGEQSLGEKAMAKAYDLRNNAEGPDKLQITTMYEYWRTGDRRQAIRNYKTWTEQYPRSAYPWILLGEFQESVGSLGQAIKSEKNAIALDPIQLSAYDSLAGYELSDGRIEDAKATCRKAFAHGYNSPDLHRVLRNAAFFQHDTAALQEQIAWFRNNADEETRDDTEADIDLSQGKIHAGIALWLHEADLQKKESRSQASLEELANIPLLEADMGLNDEAQKSIRLFEPMPAVNAEATTDVIMAAAEIGKIDIAEEALQHMLEKNKEDSDVLEFFGPEARAAIALARNKPSDAIKALQPAFPYELVFPSVSDLRGRAYLAAKSPELAAKEFRLIIDRPYAYGIGPGIATAHLGLARALEMQGNHAGARQEYKSFFTLWTDADPDLPLLQQARMEYAQLK